MARFKTLDELQSGEGGVICCVLSEGSMRTRLLDIGFCEDTPVTCVGCSPLGDPKAYMIRGTVIAIRAGDGGRIVVREE